MMTEQEAKKKTCPYLMPAVLRNAAQLASLAGANMTDEHADKILKTGLCCATECMAWRAELGYPPIRDDDMRVVHATDKRHPTGRGFCGLAGAP